MFQDFRWIVQASDGGSLVQSLLLGLTKQGLGTGKKRGGEEESLGTLSCFSARNLASFAQTQLLLSWAFLMEANQ